MKVLILTTTMAPYRVNLFNELGKYCDLTVCFEQQQENSREKSWFIEAAQGFKSVPLKNWDKPTSFIKFDIWNQFRGKIDLAIAYEYSTWTGMFFVLICKLKEIPYLINCDGAFIDKSSMRDYLKKFFISGATACLANGRHAKNYFLHHGAKENSIFLHHFTSLHEKEICSTTLNHAEKRQLRQELKIEDYSTITMTVGRFIRSKRIDTIIAAWATMPSDWLLVIVGSGELESEYRRQIDQLSLQKNILFTGHLNSELLKNWYLASDLFVLPTASDVWGLVVNEALAAGLPVITTDQCIAGLELIIDGYNGYIVPVGDEVALAEKLQTILLNETTRNELSTNALNSIKNYTIEALAKSHFEVISGVLHPSN